MSRTRVYLTLLNLVLDYFLVIGAFVTAYFFRGELNHAYLVPLGQFLTFATMAGVIYVLFFIYSSLYSAKRNRGLIDQLFVLVVASTAATAVTGSVIYFAKSFDYSRLIVGIAYPVSVLFVWVGRLVVSWFEKFLYRRRIGVTNVLIAGVGPLLRTTIRGVIAERDLGYQVVGVVPIGNLFEGQQMIEGVEILREVDFNDLRSVVQRLHVDEVILVSPSNHYDLAIRLINLCEQMGLRFKYVPDMFDVVAARIVSDDLAGMPIIELRPTLLDGWMTLNKRVIDVLLSGLALLVLVPVFILTSIAIKLDSEGPVIYRDRRVGKNSNEFTLYKFRSMRMLKKDGQLMHSRADDLVEKLKEEQPNYKLKDDPRVTSVGHFIRKTSIDELPQFWNVFIGDMSLVGPRAYLDKELKKQLQSYPQTEPLVQRLMTVKPGVTGVWQVSGRSNVDFTERVAMDAYYATHANIWLDLKILLQTIPAVLNGSGAM